MIPMDLIPEPREALEKARRLRSSNVAERGLAVLLSDRGQSVPALAESLGRHDHTLHSWLKAYLQEGIEGLKDTAAVGRTHRQEQAAVMSLQPVLAKLPSDAGDLEAGWRTTLLVDYLPRQGLEARASTVQRALKRDGWVYQRFAKTMPVEAPSLEAKKVGWTRSCKPSLRSELSIT